MNASQLTPEVIQRAIAEFYERTNGRVNLVMRTVGNENASIPRTPRKMGVFQFDYFFAADLDQIFRFALGGLQASRRYVSKLCDAVEDMLFGCAWGGRLDPPEGFRETPLGFALALTRARCALRFDDAPLAADEVRLLTGETDSALAAAGLLAEGGDAPDAVRSHLERIGGAV